MRYLPMAGNAIHGWEVYRVCRHVGLCLDRFGL